MAGATSNLESEIAPMLRDLGGLLKLNLARKGKTLGNLAADVIAAGIQNRTLDQQRSPDGSAIPQNRGRYGRKKRQRGVKVGVGLYGEQVGGELLSFEQVRGQVAVSEDQLVMEQGLDQETKNKGAWLTNGNPSKNQPPRPWYELDPSIEDDVFDLITEAAEANLRDMGAF